jgi:hypothetical protein
MSRRFPAGSWLPLAGGSVSFIMTPERFAIFCTGEIMSRVIACIAALGTVGALAALAAQAGSDKVWRPFLSNEAYQELAKRSKERIAKLPKGDKTARAETEILAGYALSLKDAKSGAKVKVGELVDIMNLLRNQAKGGEGIALDLQYSAKVKNQNGIEALINALAAKKLTDANAGKMARELELLSDRVAVIASLTLERGPEKQKEYLKQWNEQAIEMRDAALELAEGARKKDAPAIFEASKRLENSCVECHGTFK